MGEVPTKTCAGPCGLDLPCEAFHKDAKNPDGRRHVCTGCFNKKRRKTNRRSPTKQKQNLATGPNVTAFEADFTELLEIGRAAEVGVDFENATESTADEVTARLLAAGILEAEIAEMTPPQAWKLARDIAKSERLATERDRRRASDFEPMRPEDFVAEFDTGIANRSSADTAQAAREKRQEFNENMGRFYTDLEDAAASAPVRRGEIASALPAKHAQYIRDLSEQERRFGNRRRARSIAIAEAHEQLSREASIYVAETFFKDKVEPTGYARFPKPETPAKRTACVLLSDLHLGSELDSLDEPVAFKAVEESRRLEWVLRQFLDFKPQYRETTEALVILNGDIIEGDLQHDIRSGAPLTEQKAIFWQYFTRFIALVAQQYKSVRVVCQPGNHGRNKLRHPGRATSSKWDGFEFDLYYALRMMCSELKNVSWDIPFRAISIVDLHGQILGVSHADTELKLGDPDTKARENFSYLSKVNSTNLYNARFDGFAFGHYHKGRFQPGEPSILWNGPLVPPNGHARTSGYIGELCGQWIWEAVEDHLFGDLRFIKVGVAQDHDERLGSLIPPFRFSMFADN